MVARIAHWRYHDGLGYGTIADRLNADPTKYPPPKATNPERTRGAWSKSSVLEILRNPKYTGYQVFNRRARKSQNGKVNDPIKWVWSPEPVHEPLIPKWMYDELSAQRTTKRGSRDGSAANTHPATKRTYLLRGLLRCGCGRRMQGVQRHGTPYYTCWPRGNNRGRPDKYEGHAKAIYIREDSLLDAITRFYADRVFGVTRREILKKDLTNVDDRAAQERESERKRLQRTVADLARRQEGIMRQVQDGNPDDPFARGLRETYNDLDGQKSTALAAIARIDTADQT